MAAFKYPDGRRWGDKLAHTQVVAVDKRKRPVLIGIIAFVLLIPLIYLNISFMINNKSAANTAIKAIRNNERITAVVGRAESFSYSLSDSIKHDGDHSTADIKIEVQGSKGELLVYVELYRNPDADWAVKRISY